MGKKNFLIALFLILIAIIVAIGLYLYNFQNSKANVSDLIPSESAIVLKVNNPINLFQDIATYNQIWKSLDSTMFMYQLLSEFTTAESILKNESKIYGSLSSNPFYMAIIPDSTFQKVHKLFIQELNTDITLNRVQKVIEELPVSVRCTNYNDHILLINPANSDTLFIKLQAGLIAITDRLEMLETSRRNNTGPSSLNSFLAKNNTKSDASLFINYDNLGKIITFYSKKRGSELLELISNFASWTETDIKIKKDEILFSGFSSIDSTNFLAKFKGQSPLPNKVINVIPFNTSFLYNQCFSDFKRYASESILEKYNNISDHIGTEVALINNGTADTEMANATYAIIQLSNGAESQKAFVDYGKKTGSYVKEKYESFYLYKINEKKLLENLFGKLYSDLTKNWYTFIEDYIIFSNSKERLVNFIRLYNTGKTLDLNENFQKFSDNISTKSNVLIYFQPDVLIPYAEDFFQNSFAEKLMSQKENINDIQGIAMQFSAGENLFYSSFYLKHAKSKKAENLSLWKVQLDDNAVGKPTLVWDHNSRNYNVVVFDQMANMYLINSRGQIQWKKRIDGQPLSDIFEVDFYKNGKIQYLFNTKDFIYLIDKNGNFVESYPIKISPSATNGLSLFDYKGNKDYRLMIAQADKKVHNYTIKGKAVFGWDKPKTKDIVSEEITRVVAGSKDYFVITDMSNNISIVNRRGNQRIKLEDHIEKAHHSSYYENKTNSKGIIITTDEEGKLVYISSSGKLQFTEFAKFSPQHYFLYKDFKGNGVNEFIFLDGRELKVYDRFKKVLFSYEFNSQINEKPVIFNLGRKAKALGVVASTEKTIYLFDQNGNTIINRGIVGQTPFTVGSINNDSELNLITASENILFNYRLK